jgi:hypothetical protein
VAWRGRWRTPTAEREGREMADIFRTYRVTWADSSFGSAGYFTSDNFAPGINVYASTALSVARPDSENVVFRTFAFISAWGVYGASGEIVPVDPGIDLFRNSVFIDNCANITFGVFTAGGWGSAQITVFSR